MSTYTRIENIVISNGISAVATATAGTTDNVTYTVPAGRYAVVRGFVEGDSGVSNYDAQINSMRLQNNNPMEASAEHTEEVTLGPGSTFSLTVGSGGSETVEGKIIGVEFQN